MVLNPRWLEWLEEDNDGNLTILKENTPDDIREEYEKILQLEKESIKKNGFKSTII